MEILLTRPPSHIPLQFLCIDPVKDEEPHPQDAEEHIWVVQHVPVPDLKRIIREGRMMSVATTASFLALDLLQERGLL